MKKSIILLLGIVLLYTFSCTKNVGKEEKTTLPVDSKVPQRSGTVLYKASEEYLKEQSKKNLEEMIKKINPGGMQTEEWPYHECALLTDASSVLQSITVTEGNIFCGGPATIQVVYLWTVIERAGDVRPDYTFKVIPNILVGDATTISAVPTGTPGCIFNHPDWGCWGYSYNYVVTVQMDYYNFTAPNTTNRVTATHSPLGPCKGEPPVVVDHTGNLDYPCSYYTTNVAHVNVFGLNGRVAVADYCNTFCNGQPPHYLCPNFMTFQYKLSTATTYTTVTITGAQIIPLPPNVPGEWYDYICTNTYSCGNSLPKIGTFTVN